MEMLRLPISPRAGTLVSLVVAFCLFRCLVNLFSFGFISRSSLYEIVPSIWHHAGVRKADCCHGDELRSNFLRV